MHTTPVSLLERLRQPGQQVAWERFVKLYTPLLFTWGQRLGLQEPDAADLTQEVLAVLVQKLPEFTYQPGKSFHGWLRTLLLNRWRNLRRRHHPQPLNEQADALPDPAGVDVAEVLAEEEYRRYVLDRALELIQVDFQPATWKAFWECQVAGRAAAEVADELGLGVGAVRAAKFRVLSRLRQELQGLLD
jgi:RNA polymerase sigma-70 factor (ECF subfamily)